MALISPLQVERDIHITDEFKAVVQKTASSLNIAIHFEFGEYEHVQKALKELPENERYPLILLELPIPIQRNRAGGYYGKASIGRIVIATATDKTKPPKVRLETVMKPIIKPIVNEFIKQVEKHSQTFVVAYNADYREQERYGTQNAAQGFTEYVDGYEILNMEITLKNK